MIIGVDIDGVLADFNSSFIRRVLHVCNRDLFPPRPFDIPCWDYPEHYGYTKEETSKTWESIVADDKFWQNLDSYPDATEALKRLFGIQLAGHDVYFVTSRPGIASKVQTQRWLRRHGFPEPTVLLSSAKGLCAKALKLDLYVDDRWENVFDVHDISPATRVFLLDRPWNRGRSPEVYQIETVSSALEFVNGI